jgi:hypothetical protein
LLPFLASFVKILIASHASRPSFAANREPRRSSISVVINGAVSRDSRRIARGHKEYNLSPISLSAIFLSYILLSVLLLGLASPPRNSTPGIPQDPFRPSACRPRPCGSRGPRRSGACSSTSPRTYR